MVEIISREALKDFTDDQLKDRWLKLIELQPKEGDPMFEQLCFAINERNERSRAKAWTDFHADSLRIGFALRRPRRD